MKQHYVTTFDIANLPRFAIGFDRIFEELARTQEKLNNTNGNYPPYNVVRLAETEYAFEIAVAGFEEQELTVEVVDGELVVKGEANTTEPHAGNYLHHGIARPAEKDCRARRATPNLRDRAQARDRCGGSMDWRPCGFIPAAPRVIKRTDRSPSNGVQHNPIG